MPAKVRRATAADEDAVFRLLPQLIEERSDTPAAREVFRDLLRGETGAVLVADEGGTILGLITMSFVPAIRYGGRYCQVEELVIDEAARGQHLGASLVEASIAEARGAGCKEIGLYAREHNRPFYERFGLTYAGPELRLALD